MKSKIRKITVDENTYTWLISELDWDNVLLKVWANGVKTHPWFTTEKRFNNPWYFIGQVNESNRENFQFEPITPKHVAAVIRLMLKEYGEPVEGFKTIELKLTSDGKVLK